VDGQKLRGWPSSWAFGLGQIIDGDEHENGVVAGMGDRLLMSGNEGKHHAASRESSQIQE
jgi:hypothetical protein